jgi:hypothetical protein
MNISVVTKTYFVVVKVRSRECTCGSHVNGASGAVSYRSRSPWILPWSEFTMKVIVAAVVLRYASFGKV